MNPTGNTFLITGGGSGIGRELALHFQAQGNQVIIAGRRKAVLDEVAAAGPGIVTYELDIADAGAIADFAARVTAEHPALNVVIHNAGIMVPENLSADDFLATAEATVATNLLGPIRLTSALLPHLRRQANPAIVTVSSGLAFVPLAATPTYSATKAAIHNWSQSLRHQLAGSVEVIELAPPGVQTDLMPGHGADPQMMPLGEFIDETMALFARQPTPAEILVQRVRFLRDAEREGRFDAVFGVLNG